MQASKENLIALRKSPLVEGYKAFLFSPLSIGRSSIEPTQTSVLHGRHVKRYPLIALTTQRSMGPSRHILSQMVVAGTMVVHPPYNPKHSSPKATN